MHTIFTNKKLFILVLLLFLIFFIIFVSIFSFLPKTSQSTTITIPSLTPNKNQINPIHVLTISPDEEVLLPYGIKPKFTLTFDGEVPPSRLQFTFQETSSHTKIPLILSFLQDKKNILLTSSALTGDDMSYSLIITDIATNKIILSKTYISDIPTPTPVSNNNKELIPYLPYQTPRFLLEYNATLNIYIFHFFVDPNGTDDLGKEFYTAKADAIKFIQSKGIDPTTLVIEWKSS
jgi:hypothetical protein